MGRCESAVKFMSAHACHAWCARWLGLGLGLGIGSGFGFGFGFGLGLGLGLDEASMAARRGSRVLPHSSVARAGCPASAAHLAGGQGSGQGSG